MGGGQAYVIGLRNLDRFCAIGQFSAGILSDGQFDYERYVPGVIGEPQRINRKLELLWISCGTKDPRYQDTSTPWTTFAAVAYTTNSTKAPGATNGSSGDFSCMISHSASSNKDNLKPLK